MSVRGLGLRASSLGFRVRSDVEFLQEGGRACRVRHAEERAAANRKTNGHECVCLEVCQKWAQPTRGGILKPSASIFWRACWSLGAEKQQGMLPLAVRIACMNKKKRGGILESPHFCLLPRPEKTQRRTERSPREKSHPKAAAPY